MAKIFMTVRDGYKNLKWMDDAINNYQYGKLEIEEIRKIRSKLEEEKEAGNN